MKVKLTTIDVTQEEQWALRRCHGRKGFATRNEVRDYLEGIIDAYLENMVLDYGPESEDKR